MARLPGKRLRQRHAFVFRLVGEHRAVDHVADGVDTVHTGLEMPIGRTRPRSSSLTPASSRPRSCGVGNTADAHQHHIGFQNLRITTLGWFDRDFQDLA